MLNKKHTQKNIGVLYIVATPIGNLKDISSRALEILANGVDIIAAEDTRHSKKLLQHYGINTPLISLHDYNEKKRSEVLIDYLLNGKNIALISDAGTPLISDPGYRLVKSAQEQNIKVIPIPGACAAIAALSASGLATDRFVFEGFLSAKKSTAQKRLQELECETRTTIFYVAPHALLASIKMMIEIFGEARQVVLCKELTKIFETIYSATLLDVYNWLAENAARQKGEFVLLLAGFEKNTCETGEENNNTNVKQEIAADVQRILKILLRELPPKLAAKLTAEITTTDKKKLYELAIRKG